MLMLGSLHVTTPYNYNGPHTLVAAMNIHESLCLEIMITSYTNKILGKLKHIYENKWTIESCILSYQVRFYINSFNWECRFAPFKVIVHIV